MSLKICCISDTHTMLNRVELPEADLLIHAGDATFRGTIKELTEFNNHLGKIKHKYKKGILFVPGNHDCGLDNFQEETLPLITNAKVLIDELIEIEGIKIYGSPYTPAFGMWSFMLTGNDLLNKWNQIPQCDVLVTHGPPHGKLDLNQEGEHCGCMYLSHRLTEVKTRYHVFGHIHEGYGVEKGIDTTFINASICNRNYKPINKPIVMEI